MSDVVDPVQNGEVAGGGTGEATPNWRESLPDDIRNDPGLEPIKDVAGLAKSYINAQKLIGRDKIPVPGENATPEEWRAVYQRLGMPENADGYEFEVPKEWGESEKATLKTFHEKAHELGLSKAQTKKLVEWNLEMGGKQQELLDSMQAEKLAQAVAKLEVDWGKKGSATWNDKYGAARAAEEHFAKDIPELKAALAETGAGDHPAVLRLFARLGDGLKEAGLKGFGHVAPEEARSKLESMMKDPEFQKRLFSDTRSVRQAALDEQARVIAQANGVEYK